MMASVRCFRRNILLVAIGLSITPASSGQQLMPVRGHSLFLKCEGTATGPTVVLLAGAGGTTKVWDKVQPRVASFAKVCSYDRAGLGRSSSAANTQSADEIVDDLEALLKAARVLPPYLLVGHSIGGLYARIFDEQNDSDVLGIVLVDSSHEEQLWRFAKSEPDALREYPDWKNTSLMTARGFLPPGTRLSWHFNKPLTVLEHGIPLEPAWHKMQEDLAERSPKGKLITAWRSRHYIQEQQPELVVQSIRDVLAQAAQ